MTSFNPLWNLPDFWITSPPLVDAVAMRIGNVIEPLEYETLFPYYFKHPEVRRRNAFCYIDARDLGQIEDLCIQKDGLGFMVFNAGNDHNGAIIPSKELANRFFPGVPLSRELGEDVALFSNRKCWDSRNSITDGSTYRTVPKLPEPDALRVYILDVFG